MRKIRYAGSSLVTSDAVADRVLRYAAALAEVGHARVLAVPTIDLDGVQVGVELVLGPASQIVSEETGYAGDVDDAWFIGHLDQLMSEFETRRRFGR